MKSYLSNKNNFILILIIIVFTNCSQKPNYENIDKILFSKGPLEPISIEIKENGEYICAGSIRNIGKYNLDNKFSRNGLAFSYYYSSNEIETFKYFERILNKIAFFKVNKIDHNTGRDIIIGENRYNLIIYFKNGNKKQGIGEDFPVEVMTLINELMDTPQKIKLNKIEKTYIFETLKEVY